MRKIKLFRVLAVSTVLTISLCACGSEKTNTSTTDSATVTEESSKTKANTETVSEPTPTTEDKPTPEDIAKELNEAEVISTEEVYLKDDGYELKTAITFGYFDFASSSNWQALSEDDLNNEEVANQAFAEWNSVMLKAFKDGDYDGCIDYEHSYEMKNDDRVVYSDLVQYIYKKGEEEPYGVGITTVLDDLSDNGKKHFAMDLWNIAVELKDAGLWTANGYFADEVIELVDIGNIYEDLAVIDGVNLTEEEFILLKDKVELGEVTVREASGVFNLDFNSNKYTVNDKQMTYKEVYNLLTTGSDVNYNQQGIIDFGKDIFLIVEYSLPDDYTDTTAFAVAHQLIDEYIKDEEVTKTILDDVFTNGLDDRLDVLIESE